MCYLWNKLSEPVVCYRTYVGQFSVVVDFRLSGLLAQRHVSTPSVPRADNQRSATTTLDCIPRPWKKMGVGAPF